MMGLMGFELLTPRLQRLADSLFRIINLQVHPDTDTNKYKSYSALAAGVTEYRQGGIRFQV